MLKTIPRVAVGKHPQFQPVGAGQRHRIKDIGVEEPTIEEVIRTFYASRSGKAA